MGKAKRYLLYGLVLIIIIGFIFTIKSGIFVKANPINANKITVYGHSEQFFAPDTAYVTIMVNTNNSDISEAQTQNNTKINDIKTILIENNILEENINTKESETFEKYDFRLDGEYLFENVVYNYIDFKTNNIEGLDALISNLKENGVAICNVKYHLEDRNSNYALVFNDAVENALAKAKAITGKDNLEVIEVIEENCFNYAPKPFNKFMQMEAPHHNNLEQIKIGANVKVVFE